MAVLEEKRRELQTSTKICEWGTSRAVRIPKKICDDIGVSIGDMVDMTAGIDEKGSFIVIRPEATHRSFSSAPYVSLDRLFHDYDGDFTPAEFDWGDDVGAEVVR